MVAVTVALEVVVAVVVWRLCGASGGITAMKHPAMWFNNIPPSMSPCGLHVY